MPPALALGIGRASEAGIGGVNACNAVEKRPDPYDPYAGAYLAAASAGTHTTPSATTTLRHLLNLLSNLHSKPFLASAHGCTVVQRIWQ